MSRRGSPERLPGIVDAHCHLQDPAFDVDRDAVIQRARLAGIERLLVPGYDLGSSRAAVALAAAHPGLIHAAVGIHPHHVASATASDWEQLERLAREPGVVAIGEIGLDWHRNLSPEGAQREAFARQLALADGLGLPVVIHDREAHAEVSDALLRRRHRRGILHAFSGDAAMAASLVAGGYLVSFALPVAFRSASGPRAAAASIPDGSFLVETDAPWLAPGGRGARNEPTTVLRVAGELARLRGTDATAITANVRAAYDRLLGG